MPDPVMVTVATTLVVWATTAVADQARSATAAVLSFIRERFSQDPQRQALDNALTSPEEQPAIAHLAELLEQEASSDPEFAADLQRLWERANNAVRDSAADSHSNQVTGNVSGSVVQARDVRGGISFGQSHDRPGS